MATTWFDYDEVGNLIWTRDPRMNEATFGYDQRNRKIFMNSPITSDRSPITGHTMVWQYDGVGNKLKEIRADDAFRSWLYDVPNRTTYATDWRMNLSETPVITTHRNDPPDGRNVTIEHVIDAKNADYKTEFDALHRKIKETYPIDATTQARIETWHYDAAGNVDSHTTVSGNTNTLEYDNRNRLHRSTWAWGGPITVTDYDAASRITSVETLETAVHFGYDAANRQVWEEQTLAGYPTRHISTPRDADGNRATLQIPGSYLLYYDYNQRNQLAHILDGNNAPFAEYQYDPAGNMTRRVGYWIYAHGDNFTYDALNRVTDLQDGDANVWFAHNHYQYDKVGREVARWRDEEGNKGDRFSYSATSQLTEVRYKADNPWTANPSNAVQADSYLYTADKLNRASLTRNGATTNYAANALNQYTGVGANALDYDPHFNVYHQGGFQYDHDAPNRLVAVNGNGHSASSTYDGLGRCVRRTIDGQTRLFTYDGWNPIFEWDGAGNFAALNIYGARTDEILGRYDAARGPLIYKHDNQGNVTFLLNGSSQVVERYSYDAFGSVTVTNGDGTGARSASNYGNRFMYTGREWLWELGLYDYRHRYYLPGLGRFIESDPTGLDAGDMNLFRYCADDPVDISDPFGLDWNYFPDQTPRDFDNIGEIKQKTANGITLRPVFHVKAEPVASADGKGFVLRYEDVDIRSQSYIRTHQKNGYGPRPAEGDYPRTESERKGTTGHENRQKMIDKRLYDLWNKDGTFRRAVEDGTKYKDADAAQKGREQIEKRLKDRFEDARNANGQKLQDRDGKYH